MPAARTSRSPKDTAPKFDLSTRRMAESITFALRDPLDVKVELDAHVTIYSPRSKPMREVADRRPITIGEGGKVEMTDEAFEETMLERAIASVKEWDLVLNGEPLPHDESGVRRVFTDPSLGLQWVGDQVRAKLMKVADFFGARPNN